MIRKITAGSGASKKKTKLKATVAKETLDKMYLEHTSADGICDEDRSMISPDYARNFICDFILGKVQKNTQLDLFENYETTNTNDRGLLG